jgi:hypothetical protein
MKSWLRRAALVPIVVVVGLFGKIQHLQFQFELGSRPKKENITFMLSHQLNLPSEQRRSLSLG